MVTGYRTRINTAPNVGDNPHSTFSTKQLQFWGGEFYGHFSALLSQCIENSAKLSHIKAASSFVCNTKSPSPLSFGVPAAKGVQVLHRWPGTISNALVVH
jgi:hypothetical protein